MPRFEVNGRSPAAFLLNSTRVIRRDDTITHGSVRWMFYDGTVFYGSGSNRDSPGWPGLLELAAEIRRALSEASAS